MNSTFHLPRRKVLKGLGAAGAAAAFPASIRPLFAASVAPITIVINQSPWFESFRKTVEVYEAGTGNKVELDVNPFAGSLEKQRNSVRSSEGQYDILIMNSGWFTEMYAGGFIEAITDIDPGFQLDADVYTLGDTVYYNAEKKSVTKDGKLMSVSSRTRRNSTIRRTCTGSYSAARAVRIRWPTISTRISTEWAAASSRIRMPVITPSR
jgi:multiple sugar transport system substrate-binding protein